VAADRSSVAPRVFTALSWAAGISLFSRLSGYYLHFWDVKRHHLESASFVLIAAALAAVLSRAGATGDETVAAHSPPRSRFLVLTFAAVGTMLYWPALNAGLFADDYVLLAAAREGRFTVWTQQFRPMMFLVWRAADRLTSNVPLLLHAINVALHVLNGVVVYLLARRTGVSWRAGGAAGLLFLCFPAAVEAVAWPAGIQDVLMTTFVLGFLLAISSPAITVQRTIAAATLLLAALLTKETAVVAPILAALFCLIVPVERRRWIQIAASAAAVAAFVMIRFAVVPLPSDYLGPLDRYRTKEILVRPFASLSVPLREAEVAAVPLVALILATAIVLMIVLASGRWHRRDRRFHASLALAAFVLVSIAPVHAYFSVTADLHGSRYLYLASAAWSVLLVTLAESRSLRMRAAGVVLISGVLVSGVVFTRRHVEVWHDAGAVRDRILTSAQRARLDRCPAWTVTGLPAVVEGVPTFVNGFPEAMRTAGRTERFHVGPQAVEADECAMRWTGTEFVEIR
jgi:hypothetical protein